ncbi:MAG TPA: peptide deformylase [Chloroflexota bacterium]|nr:peptide deformylase [Chloroflexota bacterium]
MTVRRIVILGEPVLRQKAKKIHRVDNSIRLLLDDMVETMKAAPGAGLAAPQVGVPLRAIVTNVDDKVRVVINPEIVEQSDEEYEDDEGCLSIPGWWGPVKRRTAVTVRGLGRTGKPVKIKAEGLEARCFQHEIDHLDGILFIDRMEDRSKLYKVESAREEQELEEEHAFT